MRALDVRRAVYTLLYLAAPCLLILALGRWADVMFWELFAAIWLVTIVGFVVFFRLRPCGFWALLIGVAASPLLVFIDEYRLGSEFLQYLVTALSFAFYAVPASVIALIALAVVEQRRKGALPDGKSGL